MVNVEYIIGSGSAAFAARKIFSNAKVIAPEETFKRSLPPVFYLWKTPATRRFIAENYGSAPEATIRVGVIGKSTPKTVSAYNKLTCKERNNKPCEGKKDFKAFELSMPKVHVDIETKVDCIMSREKTLLLYKHNPIRFRNIVFTAPYSVLDSRYEMTPIYTLKGYGEMDGDWDFAYLMDEEYLDTGLYRVKREKDNGFTFEFYKEISKKEKAIKLLESKGFHDLSIPKVCSAFIMSNTYGIPEDRNGVHLVGRYAQWDYEVKMSDCIEKLYRIKKMIG